MLLHKDDEELSKYNLKNNSQLRLVTFHLEDPKFRSTVFPSVEDGPSAAPPSSTKSVTSGTSSNVFYKLYYREDAESLIPVPPHDPPKPLKDAELPEIIKRLPPFKDDPENKEIQKQ